MSRTVAREIAILLVSASVAAVVPSARGDDPKAQAEKRAAKATAPKATASKAPEAEARKAPADPGREKPKEAAAKAAPVEKKAAGTPAAKSISFMRDVAPILVENCIACHNPRKSESKYVMTTFAQLAKGGQQGEGLTLEPGKPDESNLVELIRPGGEPRMPYKQDPLPPEKIATIERWVAEGARYDGGAPTEDWTILLRKTQSISVPEAYPIAVPITALEFTRDGSAVAASGFHEITFWKTGDGALGGRLGGLAERTYDVAYSPDGKWMATASGDPGIYGIARLWAAQPGAGAKPVRELVETQDVLFSVAFSPDSKRVATAGAGGALRNRSGIKKGRGPPPRECL
jgi:WD40 repeat protein